jgi:hypothetical protein
MALTFEIKSGKAVLSDPCYTLGTWCAAVLDNVKNGTWGVYVEREPIHKRNASLLAYNLESLFEHPLLEHDLWNAPPLPQLAGVDSGQFGFFDFDGYRNDESITPDVKLWDYTETEPGDKFYSACCNLTVETKESYGVLPLGVVSSSGWGDGSYELRAVKNSAREYIGFLVIFMEDEKLNDEEDDFWREDEDEEDEDDSDAE